MPAKAGSSCANACPIKINQIKATLPPHILTQPARALMTVQIDQLSTKDSIADTLQYLNQHRHSYYPVADEEGKTVGVLSREHFYDYVQTKGLQEGVTVTNMELEAIPVVRPDTDIQICLETVIRSGSNKLLVVDQTDTLTGILTIRDVLGASVEAQKAGL